jgi:predicted TIM-barrel fold metal-dependent hydrolase
MNTPHLTREALSGKIIDVHNHVGISIKSMANLEYPYAATVEGIAYRQRACNVDVSVVFPYTPDLYFDPVALAAGRMVPAQAPLSPAPYAAENAMVAAEVFRFCPELSHRFIPFVCLDPGRAVAEQVHHLMALAETYPIYGIKVSPILCQSPVARLLQDGAPLMDLAVERGWPVLFHAVCDPREGYSHASDIFRIIAAYPTLRYCLAHCLGFHRGFLDEADAAGNVWVDTAALKIQVELVHAGSPLLATGRDRFDADYSDHRSVMRSLAEQYPETIVWGSDTPAYSYIMRRQQAEGYVEEFRLKGTYEDEKAALDALPPALRERVSNLNTLDFLMGVNAGPGC